ncbi:MAG: chloride channel protein [Thermoplasmata archaeon]
MTLSGTEPTQAPRPIPGLTERFRAFGGSFIRSFSDLRTLYRWALIGITIGVISGFVAVAFFYALEVASDGFLGSLIGIHLPVNGGPGPNFNWTTNPSTFWILPGLLALGGLAVGLLTTYVAPETEGHGTDQSIRAFHHGRGVVRSRVPPIKFLVSVLTIGTGGSGGREGPTAQIGSGIGSIVAGPLGLSTRERKIALMVGLGAGIGAIFKAPFGAALLASEVLYIADFEPDVIMPSILASVISYSIFGAFDGYGPEFTIPGGAAALGWSPEQLLIYALLGGVAALAGILYVVSFKNTRRFFRTLKVPRWSIPAIGVSIMGAGFVGAYYLLPQENHLLAVGSIGIGYGVVQWLIFQNSVTPVLLALVIALVFVKIAATSLTVGSGGSAGLFGPGIFTGAFLGFAVAGVMTSLFPGTVSGADFAAFAVIGMMAFFGSVSKAPIAVILMVVEMTGSDSLLVPAMVAIFIAYYLAGPYRIYDEQVPNRLASPTHTTEYFSEFLRHVPVREVLAQNPPKIDVSKSVSEANAMLHQSSVPVLAVLRGQELVGEVRLADVLGIPVVEQLTTPVGQVLRENPPPVHATMSVLAALGVMDQEQTDVVLVFSDSKPRTLEGVLTRERITEFQKGSKSQW